MAFDQLVDRSGAEALIPEEAATTIIQSLPEASAALSSFRRVTMSRGQQRLPVLSVLPHAYWVDGDTGLKQTDTQAWKNKYLDARELAVIIAIPEAVLDDSSFDIWGEIRPRLVEAFGIKIDAAAIFGVDKPSVWPEAIVPGAIAAGNVVAEGDAIEVTPSSRTPDFLDYVNETIALVEDDGFDVSGFWGRRRIRSRLRGLRDANGQPVLQPATQGAGSVLYGEPLAIVSNGAWVDADATLVAGDTSQAILAVRKDITYKMLTEAVISDDDGKVILNLAQQDAVALRAVMRVAYQVANPLTRSNEDYNTRFPFAALQPEAS